MPTKVRSENLLIGEGVIFCTFPPLCWDPAIGISEEIQSSLQQNFPCGVGNWRLPTSVPLLGLRWQPHSDHVSKHLPPRVVKVSVLMCLVRYNTQIFNITVQTPFGQAIFNTFFQKFVSQIKGSKNMICYFNNNNIFILCIWKMLWRSSQQSVRQSCGLWSEFIWWICCH